MKKVEIWMSGDEAVNIALEAARRGWTYFRIDWINDQIWHTLIVTDRDSGESFKVPISAEDEGKI